MRFTDSWTSFMADIKRLFNKSALITPYRYWEVRYMLFFMTSLQFILRLSEKMRFAEQAFQKMAKPNDISFSVQEGEVLGIVGRNGAGKSTLLKLLSRITSPSSGTLRIKGRMASLLEVGTGFHPELTGRENIFLNRAILGMRRKEIAQKFE